MPLHKSGHRTDPMNYHIIAFMCALCKAYDGALAERLTDWAKKFNILAPTQYGYREQSETIDMWYTYVQVIRERQTRGLPTYLKVLSASLRTRYPDAEITNFAVSLSPENGV